MRLGWLCGDHMHLPIRSRIPDVTRSNVQFAVVIEVSHGDTFAAELIVQLDLVKLDFTARGCRCIRGPSNRTGKRDQADPHADSLLQENCNTIEVAHGKEKGTDPFLCAAPCGPFRQTGTVLFSSTEHSESVAVHLKRAIPIASSSAGSLRVVCWENRRRPGPVIELESSCRCNAAADCGDEPVGLLPFPVKQFLRACVSCRTGNLALSCIDLRQGRTGYSSTGNGTCRGWP